MLPTNYLRLPSDQSGSSSKNRFRNELLWGLTKILEIYDSYDDFAVVFDYVCDVEVHTSIQSEYYQIKTKRGSKCYTITELCKCPKDAEGVPLPSILGKLYQIRLASEDRSLPISIVANTNLSHKKEYADKLILPFNCLEEDAKATVVKALCLEFPDKEIDITNISYIRSLIDLLRPSNSVKGCLVSWFPEKFGCEVLQPNALFASLNDAIEEKACYELKCASNEEVLKRKSITKVDFDNIINHHIQYAPTGTTLAKEWVTLHFKDNYSKRLKMLLALSAVIKHRSHDARIREIEELICSYLDRHMGELEDDGPIIVERIASTICYPIPIPYTTIEMQALVLLTMKRKEEEACQL